jgi:hypothetical protein
MINVSDDEDLLTAYEVAELELDGNLKFVIENKAPTFVPTDKHSYKIEKKTLKEKEKKDKKAKKVAKKKKTKKGEEEEKEQTKPIVEAENLTKDLNMDISDDLAR